MIRVAVTGCAGNMGSKIIRTVQEQENMEVVMGIEIPNSPLAGKDVGEQIGLGTIGVKIIGSQDLKSQSPHNFPVSGSRLTPTSITTAPSFTKSPVTYLAFPIATTKISALEVTSFIFCVFE